jgi:hypothetical protein
MVRKGNKTREEKSFGGEEEIRKSFIPFFLKKQNTMCEQSFILLNASLAFLLL